MQHPVHAACNWRESTCQYSRWAHHVVHGVTGKMLEIICLRDRYYTQNSIWHFEQTVVQPGGRSAANKGKST